MRTRAASHVILACVVGFTGLELIAMGLYPGGTFWDRATRGARFWQNFICDLESRVALNGEPNDAGARFAQAAMLLIVIGLAPFWWIVPWRFARLRRLGMLVRSLGLASLVGAIAVALTPSSRFGPLHGVAVIVAGVPGLSAAALSVVGLTCAEPVPRIVAKLGTAAVGFALVDFGLYVRAFIRGGLGPIVLPAAQKIALLLLLAWMVAVAWPDGRGAVKSSKPSRHD